MALPAEWLFLDRDKVVDDHAARERAEKLRGEIQAGLHDEPEFTALPESDPGSKSSEIEKNSDSWRVMAEVAEDYPRLLVWLTRGQIGSRGFRNVFGLFVPVVLRLLPFLGDGLFNPVAKYAPWRPVLLEAFRQQRRLARNSSAELDRFTCTLGIPAGGAPGLSAVTDTAATTPTRARAELREKVSRMSSGSVGVSGPHGVGKTALIRDFCAPRYGTPWYDGNHEQQQPRLRGLRFVVDAPMRFDTRDFIVHLYTCLCHKVLTDVRFLTSVPEGRIVRAVLLPHTVRPRALLATLAAAGLLVITVWLLAAPALPWQNPHFWPGLGIAACLVTLGATLEWRAGRAVLETREVTDLPAEARRRLRRLLFQRTDSVTRTASVSGPHGSGLSLGGTRTLAENAMSLPELIDDYRDFVARVVAALQQKEDQDAHERKKPVAPVRLVIGIDSVDKIEDPAAAALFLDELSVIFGTPNCVYLLSTRPDALAPVDPRTVPTKTASSDLFDEVVWVEPLTLQEAADFIDCRVTGMPAAFIALCHVLSGGLPRELLRVARAVCAVTADESNENGVPLATAARRVINDELRAVRHRVHASASTMGIGATPRWLTLITSEESPTYPADARWLEELLEQVAHPWARDHWLKDRPQVSDLCDCLIADLYFLLTVKQLFTATPELINSLIKLPPDTIAPDPAKGGPWLKAIPPALGELANVRAAPGLNPYLAAEQIGVARRILVSQAKGQKLPPDVKATFEEIRVPFLRD